ncbi:retroviral-like aspartic protease family protein [Escherichia coli]|uniref:retroviral-like aspartic protease family protein n=1 Tax=Escherichia coli TaxID=562 RepID=UPI00307ACBD8
MPRTRNQRNNNVEEAQEPPLVQRHAIESFRRQNPPTFDGLGEPIDAENWIRSTERIFEYIGCEEAEKLNCAIFQLTDEADFWWESVRRTLTPGQWARYTWEDFKEELMEKYVPGVYRQRRQNEFWNLRQGRRTVTEYDRSFNRLSRYATYLVGTEAARADRFRRGLRPEIGISLVSQGDLTYAQSLNRALNIESMFPQERTMPPGQPSDGGRGKRKWEDRGKGNQVFQGNQSGPVIPRNQGIQERERQPWGRNFQPMRQGVEKPWCQKCQRNHFGECRQGSTECYRCKKSGHYARDCPLGGPAVQPPVRQHPAPQRQNQAPPRTNNGAGGHPRPANQRPPQQARVYALNQQQAAQAPGNLAGIIHMSDIPVFALFDTGASHSFVSRIACERLGLVPKKSQSTLEISIPSGEVLKAKEICQNQEVEICEQKVLVNLHVIGMEDFDVIFGMDWLEKHMATIRCLEREVAFRTAEGVEVCFHGIRMGVCVPMIDP